MEKIFDLTMHTTREARTVRVVHPHWKDNVKLLSEGSFFREIGRCRGTWEETGAGELVLNWFEWDKETFECDHCGVYRLVRRKKGFNGDGYIARKLKSLIKAYGVRLVVETGTNKGDTAWALSEMVEQVKTIEVNGRIAGKARHALRSRRNVEVVEGNSALLMSELLRGVREPVLFYLDAHWLSEWPLLDELRAIAQSEVQTAIIAIHDFEVKDLGCDAYDGMTLNFDYVQRSIREIFPEGFSWETNSSERTEGARRGIAYFHGGRRHIVRDLAVKLKGQVRDAE